MASNSQELLQGLSILELNIFRYIIRVSNFIGNKYLFIILMDNTTWAWTNNNICEQIFVTSSLLFKSYIWKALNWASLKKII